jgi:hypothetical protein
MKKNIIAISVLIFLASCSTKKMYYWGKYDQATYQHNKKQTEETKSDLLTVYENIIEKKNKGTRNEVPPGVYADYGYLLIQEGQIEKGKEMLEKEIAFYPESKKIVLYILNKI